MDILSVDTSAIVRGDFEATVSANVTQSVAGWTPLMDSSMKGSAVISTSHEISHHEHVVRSEHITRIT